MNKLCTLLPLRRQPLPPQAVFARGGAALEVHKCIQTDGCVCACGPSCSQLARAVPVSRSCGSHVQHIVTAPELHIRRLLRRHQPVNQAVFARGGAAPEVHKGRFKVVLAWLSKQSRRGMLDKLPMDGHSYLARWLKASSVKRHTVCHVAQLRISGGGGHLLATILQPRSSSMRNTNCLRCTSEEAQTLTNAWSALGLRLARLWDAISQSVIESWPMDPTAAICVGVLSIAWCGPSCPL